ncbi:hypothetical protein BACCIP111895_02766 [Neobacillus rhizosphaerae]|jgi:hypothetical protein|uniref:GapA-binding peptide SR1P n=1 Tax=Neobacillus rhizosphaerae TaxID=2880965 RepID=A0ABM9ETR3_9BACI|nr:hypothetical protein [Neobacillus rhizosphaerae]CAH2715582.1 hypothetical protein BACCIP111895_02766 [Neobacillus rhizosphaerae]
MKELVGLCISCNKEIFCLDGFFNGVITKEKENYCFECYQKISKIEEKPQS